MEDKEDKLITETLKELEYTIIKDVLVKPLTPVKVTKEIIEQVPTGEKDENGYNLYDTKSEVKEVDSDWSIGVVLALPEEVTDNKDAYKLYFGVGDTVVYNKKFAKDFDLFKNCQLVRAYDIIAKHNRK